MLFIRHRDTRKRLIYSGQRDFFSNEEESGHRVETSDMKKLVLLGLITVGLGFASSSAQAGGFSFSISLGRHYAPPCPPPVYVAPPPPVCVRPVVVPRPIVCAPVCAPGYHGHGHRIGHYRGPYYDRGYYYEPRSYAAVCEPAYRPYPSRRCD